MSIIHGEALKKRALGFLRNAKDNFERGEYDLVLFHVEQFLQLYLKYLLYRRVGEYPKMHSTTYLLKEVMKAYGESALKQFYDENLEVLTLLEDAYITSRYLLREYEKEIAEKVLGFADKALGALEWMEKQP
ncbi:MAG: HEPN domain-containing protein [Thermoproteota archaeon]